MQLKLTKRTVDGILAIEGNGRIVFGEESSLLREEVKRAIADGQKRIVLNLGEVTTSIRAGWGRWWRCIRRRITPEARSSWRT